MKHAHFADEKSFLAFMYREAQFLRFMPYPEAKTTTEFAQVCKDSIRGYYSGEGVMMTGIDELIVTSVPLPVAITRVYIPHTINMAWFEDAGHWYAEVTVLV